VPRAHLVAVPLLVAIPGVISDDSRYVTGAQYPCTEGIRDRPARFS